MSTDYQDPWWGEENCCYIGCNNKCNGYSAIIINGFMIHYKVCMDHWDLFGKNVAAFHGQVNWLDAVRKQFKEEE